MGQFSIYNLIFTFLNFRGLFTADISLHTDSDEIQMERNPKTEYQLNNNKYFSVSMQSTNTNRFHFQAVTNALTPVQ